MSEAVNAPSREGMPWSAREDMDAMRQRPAEVAARYGRSICAVRSRREYLKEERRGKLLPHDHVAARMVVPKDVVAERDARLARQPRNIVAAIAGDPLPGYSALEKYHRDLVSA